jgi:protein-tyrosine kinase
LELIKEALNKAKASAGGLTNDSPATRLKPPASSSANEFWSLPPAVLDIKHLEEQRIVSYAMTDPSHVAFNLLRTKVGKVMKDNGWKTLAILSATSDCGKTTVSVNLALSLARQTDYRTVLIDLDLRKSAMARTLGIQAKASISEFLDGKAELQKCCVRIGENLIVTINNRSIKLSSELLSEKNTRKLLDKVSSCLRPDVVLFDLPPMLSSDDAIAFLPRVDCALLVAAAGKTTAAEIEECERQAHTATNYLGIVLNKCEMGSSEYYKYGLGGY